MSPSDVLWRRHPDAAFVDFRGRIIALPLAVQPMSATFAMQTTAAAAWRVLSDEPQSLDAIVDHLATMYAAEPETVRTDVSRLFDELEARRLAQRVDSDG